MLKLSGSEATTREMPISNTWRALGSHPDSCGCKSCMTREIFSFGK